VADEKSATNRPKEEDRLDPTVMFGGESGRIPTAAEVVAQTILQMVADGKRATARKQMERDAPLLDKHEPGDGMGIDVAAIVELARETEAIPDAFATPMAQLLRGTYAPEAKMDLVRAVRARPDDARTLRAALPEVAPAIGRIFGGLIDDALSLPPRKSGGGEGGRRSWALLVLLLVLAAAAVAYFVSMRG
jgi:hypothetical protein